tara:strand:- start:822 stop:971 length:150 start_codon:yes stop_codon:yes gene_type:complete
MIIHLGMRMKTIKNEAIREIPDLKEIYPNKLKKVFESLNEKSKSANIIF